MRQKRKARGEAARAAAAALAAQAGESLEITEEPEEGEGEGDQGEDGEPAPDAEALADAAADAEAAPAADAAALAEAAGEAAPEAEAEADADAEAAPDAEAAAAADPDAEAAPDAESPVEGDAADADAADADAAEADDTSVPDPTALDPARHKALVEALLFASEKPLTLQRLRQLTRIPDLARLQALVAELQADYQDRGVVLQELSGGYLFRTHHVFSTWVQQLVQGRPVRLSRAQLETLALVAYRQPITRPEIDQIRGVDSGGTLKVLLDRSLVRILGKKEEPGRPLLYGTTREFLDFFSLRDLRELPTLREYSELSEESRRVVERLAEAEVEAAAESEPA